MAENEQKKEEEKRPVAHEAAITLLKENPAVHINTLCDLYALGTVVPVKDIPELIKAFEEASLKVPASGKVLLVVRALNKQIKEAQKKEE